MFRSTKSKVFAASSRPKAQASPPKRNPSKSELREVLPTRDLQRSLANFFHGLGTDYKKYSLKLSDLPLNDDQIIGKIKDKSILEVMEVRNPLHRAVMTEILVNDLGNIDTSWSFPNLSSIFGLSGSMKLSPSFPKAGLTLSAIDRFISKCGGKEALAGLSTTEVNRQAQKPLTYYRQSSYCDMAKAAGDSGVKPAVVFISHAWKYIFLDVVEALQYHFRDEPDAVIWFDLFSNNQHSAPDLDFHWWSYTFKSAIKEFGRTVMVMAPWSNPIPLTRAWCLFEVYCTVETKSRFEVAMSSAEHFSFIHDVSTSYAVVDQMIGDVDVRKSNASNPEDKIKIFDAVRNTMGFDGVNSTVLNVMRSWVVGTLETAMQDEKGELEQARLQCTLGWLLRKQGLYDRALPLSLSSLVTKVEKLEEDHPDTLTSMNSLAVLYKSKKDYDSALPLYLWCLHMRKQKLGEDHPDTLDTMNNLAGLYKSKKDYDSALPLYQQCLKLRMKTLGEDHLDTITTMNNLAAFYKSKGDYTSALPLYQQCLAMREEKLGQDHPDTLTSVNNLAALYYSKKDYASALPLYVKCLEMQKEKLGEDHPDTLTSMNNLGALYYSKKDYAHALPLYLQCLEMREHKLGQDHPDTLETMNNLAGLYKSAAQDLEERKRKLEETRTNPMVKIQEKKSEKQFDIAVSLFLKCLDMRKGKLKRDSIDNIALYQHSLKLKTDKYGLNHPDTLSAMTDLASLYKSKGDYDSAQRLYRHCLKIRKSKLGPDHPNTLSSMNDLAGVYESMGDFNSALPLYQERLEVQKEKLGRDHPDTLTSMSNLANTYHSKKDYDPALSLYLQCLRIGEEKLGQDHSDKLDNMNNLAHSSASLENLLSTLRDSVKKTMQIMGDL